MEDEHILRGNGLVLYQKWHCKIQIENIEKEYSDFFLNKTRKLKDYFECTPLDTNNKPIASIEITPEGGYNFGCYFLPDDTLPKEVVDKVLQVMNNQRPSP